MVFQRASCLMAGHTGASAALKESSGARGLQCLFRGRAENPVANDDDLKKHNLSTNISVLSTDDVGTDLSSMDALTRSESADGFVESPADGFLATLPPLVETNTFLSTFHSEAEEAPVDEARLFAMRARQAFLARTQRRAARATLEDLEEVPQAELAQPLLARQLAERLRQETASHQ
jgi:hypothetical protein